MPISSFMTPNATAVRSPLWHAPVALLVLLIGWQPSSAAEPAVDFLNQLRAAGYYEMAIEYLDRLDQYPGVDAELRTAVRLEKAQTLIDAGVAARKVDRRNQLFADAEQELVAFLDAGSHPRQSGARLQLGRLQMVRAAQFQQAAVDDPAKTAEARQSYLAAADTFDAIVAQLRETLKNMRGAKIDPKQEPEQAALRDQYRFEFLEGIRNAGEARLLAAQTFDDPAQAAKQILEKSLASFAELTDKYDGYVQGAIALAFQGEVQAELGQREEATNSFIEMLEQPEVDGLREAKYRAALGLIELQLSESPPRYQAAIEFGQALADGIRPNENAIPIVQSFRVAMAKALLAKADDKDNQQPAAIRRARQDSRQLLVDASKVPGAEAAEAAALLADMGIDVSADPEPLPDTKPAESVQDAVDKARRLLTESEAQTKTLALLNQQPGDDPEVIKQKSELQQQIEQSRSLAIGLLRSGLSMARPDTAIEELNQARQILAYLLYQQRRYRSSAVVGHFLARVAAGSEIGLQGGLVALNSLQLLLVEDPENSGLANQLQTLGDYLGNTWPDDPKAAAARGTMIKLALRGGRYDEAQELIAQQPDGPEKLASLLLLGRVLWVESVQLRNDNQHADAAEAVAKAGESLLAGLQGADDPDLSNPDLLKSALTLAKVQLQQGDVAEALATLEHESYGPLTRADQQAISDRVLASDLYATELQVVVQLLSADGKDTKELLNRATAVMEKLRSSVDGPDAQQQLTRTYVRMAREIRQQLQTADAARQTKLSDAFRVFLDRIANTTKDLATLQWIAQTLIELAESSLGPNQVKAEGQAAEMLQTAIVSLGKLQEQSQEPNLGLDFQMARAQRMLGQYKAAIDTISELLQDKPMMLDAQVEAALAYEQWAAAVVSPKYAGSAYQSALSGARRDARRTECRLGLGKD